MMTLSVLRAISLPELLPYFGIAVFAVMVLLVMRSKPAAKKSDGERPAEAPAPRSFSMLAGFSFWVALVALALFASAAICRVVADMHPLLRIDAPDIERLTMATAVLSVCAAVPAGLSLLLALAAGMAVKHDRAKYGFNLAVFSGVLAVAVLLGAFLPKSSRHFTFKRTVSNSERVESPVEPDDR